LGSERTADVPGCAGRTSGSPTVSREDCWSSHWVQRGQLTPRVCGEDSWKPHMSREDCWMSLLEVPLCKERTADVPECAGRTPVSPRTSREDCWRSLLEVSLVTERKADSPYCYKNWVGKLHYSDGVAADETTRLISSFFRHPC
jgi:hypothetical protein